MKPLFILWLLVVVSGAAVAQSTDFARIDAHARNLRIRTADVATMTRAIIAPCTTDLEKARGIFVWITAHISYDCAQYHALDRDPNWNWWEGDSTRIRRILKSRLGICSDYAALCKRMCDVAGLECVVIIGWAKTSLEDVSDSLGRETNHAWNAVRLDGRWRLLDATWASGYADVHKNVFTRKFKEAYFLTDPLRFVLSHLPADPKWQLLDKPVSRRAFFARPYIEYAYHEHGVADFYPRNGLLDPEQPEVQLRIKIPLTKERLFVQVDGEYLETESVLENGFHLFRLGLPVSARRLSIGMHLAHKSVYLMHYRVRSPLAH
jgi:hypothetical protein